MKNTILFLILVIAVIVVRALVFFKVANVPSQPKSVICFGDSISAGYRLAKDESYPAQLGLIIGETVIKTAISGETSRGALTRLQRDVLDKDPRLVIVQFGGNDSFNRIPPEVTLANNDLIVEKILNAGATPVLLIGESWMKGPPYLEGFRAIAKRRDILLIENAINRIADEPALRMDDVHPSAEGCRVLAESVAASIEPLL